MGYAIKEIYYTLQGEGANTGRAAVFLRFAGCNLWTGREEDRASAACKFCDTDFVGTDGVNGGRYDLPDLVAAVRRTCPLPQVPGYRLLVVCTGGEPLLQLDRAIIDAMHAAGFAVAVETNGTREAPDGLDWLCVSPKAGGRLIQKSGDELKLVYPQEGAEPERYAGLPFMHFFLQPMDGPDLQENTRRAVAYCLANPLWRLSLQTHKFLGIP